MNYSNPRIKAVIENYPYGCHCVTATFEIESNPKHGQRAIRTTTGAPKKLTYARMVRIVDGDDGRTYIAELTSYGHISIMQSNMKYQAETIYPDSQRYNATLELFRMPVSVSGASDAAGEVL